MHQKKSPINKTSTQQCGGYTAVSSDTGKNYQIQNIPHHEQNKTKVVHNNVEGNTVVIS